MNACRPAGGKRHVKIAWNREIVSRDLFLANLRMFPSLQRAGSSVQQYPLCQSSLSGDNKPYAVLCSTPCWHATAPLLQTSGMDLAIQDAVRDAAHELRGGDYHAPQRLLEMVECMLDDLAMAGDLSDVGAFRRSTEFCCSFMCVNYKRESRSFASH